MGQGFCTRNYAVQTEQRKIDVSQAMVYVAEVNEAMAEATGVDLVSAAAAGIDSAGAVAIMRSLGLSGQAYTKRPLSNVMPQRQHRGYSDSADGERNWR